MSVPGLDTPQRLPDAPPGPVEKVQMILDERTLLTISWMARGYTHRRIQQLALRFGFPHAPSLQELIYIKEHFHQEMLAERDAEAEETLQFGLSQRAERIRRLTAVAERLEFILESIPTTQKVADPTTGEAADVPVPLPMSIVREYNSLMAAIREEMTPKAGYPFQIGKDDQWYQLLEALQQKLQARPSLNPGSPSETTQSNATTAETGRNSDSHTVT